MNRLVKTLKSTSVKLTILIFALVLIVAAAADISIHDQGLYLILFSIIYVLLPGALFIITIDKDIIRRFRVQAVIIAFFAGFSLLIGQYYLLNALGAVHLIKFTALVLSLLLAFPAARNLKQAIPTFDKEKTIDLALPYIVLVAITIVASYVALKSSVPDESAPIHIDYAYHMGNVNILTRGGDLEDTRVMGMTFKYHYFMDLYYAVLRLIFPAKIWNCIFRYPILLIAPLAAPSIYSFARLRFKRPLFCFVLTTTIIFFPHICPRITRFSAHIMNNFNNVGFTVPIAVCLAELLICSTQKDRFKYTDLILIFLLAITLTGSKGPFALIIIGTMFIFIFYCWIARRKLSMHQVLAFLSAVAAFSIIWFSILNVAINDQNVYSQNQGLLKYFDYLALLDEDSILLYHDWDPKYAPLTIPLSLIECFGASAIPFLIMLPILLVFPFSRKVHDIDYITVFNAICVCISVGGAYLLSLGYNRLYFLMLATPFIYMTAAGFFVFINKYKSSRIAIIKKLLIALSIILLGVSVICSIENPVKYTWDHEPLQGEADGIAWIRENTDENALFAVNDCHMGGKDYYYSAFTERRFFLESYGYSKNSGMTEADLKWQVMTNDQLFVSENSPVIAKNLGIDYFIFYDTSGEIPEILEKNYKLCFSNECLRIYSRT